ncbi:hypothetical protein BH23CHL10_BH23CHL10_06630 [soil metagenome]
MPRRTRLLVIALATMFTGFQPISLTRAGEDPAAGIVADLDGVAIPPTDAGQHFCHDFDFPAIHCYSTAAALEEAMVAPTSEGEASTMAAYASSAYVTVYSAPGYDGSYAHLSQNYDGLWVIGWNDRIRSFKARNSARGSFHTDWYADGSRLDFCCNSNVPQLGSTFNGTISSVYRR